jgi:leucine dehydrogenase
MYFTEIELFQDHENIVFCYNKDLNLKMLIAIHSTILGPALGGCRMWAYPDEKIALEDVLRLSRSMTYKAALSNVNFGGGKAVIIGNTKQNKTPELMRIFGQFVERLNGLYITAEDVGTTVDDMKIVRSQTRHVVGLPEEEGGSGDPSGFTALSVLTAMRACVYYKMRQDNFRGVRVAIQGLGQVGSKLARLLAEEGAVLYVTDIEREKAEQIARELKAKVISPEEIYTIDADIFCPCALGGVVNSGSLPLFKVKIIAGGANNQLAHPEYGRYLLSKGIIYVPDYVANAGGLINVSYEGHKYSIDKVKDHISKIYETTMRIIKESVAQKASAQVIADWLAERRLKKPV